MGATHDRYAEKVTVSREAFARAFDVVAASSNNPGYFDFKIAALGAPDDRAAFAAAFGQSEGRGFLGSLLAHLAELRYLDDKALTLSPQDATSQIFTPQGMTAAMLALIDTGKMVRGLAEAARRVCLVQVDNIGNGTGFLIGPQTVLTNWHVVHTLIDPATGLAKAGSAPQLACVFDFIGATGRTVHTAVEDWLVEWSPMAPVVAPYPDMTALKPGSGLDFCVIRLKGAPGRMRNWYDLTRAVVPQPAAPGGIAPPRPFFVVQHPAGLVQHIGVTSNFTTDPANATLFHHKAPTIPGSSGGICLDADFNLVALHQGQLTNAAGVFQTNVAISAAAIAAKAPNAASAVPQHDLLWRLQDRSAVIGRTRTIENAMAMNSPGSARPFLVVRGASQSGKSFTRDLVEHRLEYRSRIVVRIEGDKLPLSGADLAKTILSHAGSTAVEELPVLAGAGTTPVAAYGGEFMTVFGRLLRAALPKDEQGASPLVWLIVDRLAEETSTPTDARNFLEALFVAAMPEIRFVLIGLKGNLHGIDSTRVEAENLDDPSDPRREDLKVYLQCLFADRNLAPQADEIDRLADLALATARDLPGDGRPLLPKLAELLTKTFNTVSERWNR